YGADKLWALIDVQGRSWIPVLGVSFRFMWVYGKGPGELVAEWRESLRHSGPWRERPEWQKVLDRDLGYFARLASAPDRAPAPAPGGRRARRRRGRGLGGRAPHQHPGGLGPPGGRAHEFLPGPPLHRAHPPLGGRLFLGGGRRPPLFRPRRRGHPRGYRA